MKPGIAYPATIWVDCPYCGEGVVGENGSLMIEWCHPNQKLFCLDCGREVAFPKRVKTKGDAGR